LGMMTMGPTLVRLGYLPRNDDKRDRALVAL
jgi:hypothetical protein